MKPVVICCEILKGELSALLEKTKTPCPVVWISAEYHSNPGNLRNKLQLEIDLLTDADRIFLGFGCCGNAVAGLKATTADLIIPRADDCIEIMLSSTEQSDALPSGASLCVERPKNTYFLSKGWLESAKGLLAEYDRMIKRYGPDRARRLFNKMLYEYRFLMFLNTGVAKAELEVLLEKSRQLASVADLELIVQKAACGLLEKMVKHLNGAEEELRETGFLIVKKGETVSPAAFLKEG